MRKLKSIKERATDFYSNMIAKPTGDFTQHISNIASHGRFKLLSYRQEERSDLLEIKLAYEQHILQGKEVSTVEKSGTIFEIAIGEKTPEARTTEIMKCFIYEHKLNRGKLNAKMQALHKIIKACVNARFASAASNYTYIDGAAILFCAEFSTWINTVAKLPIDESLLDDIQNRICYLNHLEEKDIFKNEVQADYAIDILIFHLQQILEKDILPEIQAKLSEQTSREAFEGLIEQAKAMVNNIAIGLFCLFTETENLSDTFDLETFSHVSLDAQNMAFNNPLGSAIAKLVPAYQLQSTNKIDINHFLTEAGEPLSDILEELSQLDNVLEEKPSKAEKKITGIHKYMETNEQVKSLVMTLGFLEDYCYLIQAFRQAYSLSGIGGDLLLYLALCKETGAMLACYKLIENRLSFTVASIRETAEQCYTQLKIDRKKSPWQRNYLLAKRYFNYADEARLDSSKSVQKILNAMHTVQTPMYAEKIRDEIAHFRETIGLIEERLGKSGNLLSVQASKMLMLEETTTFSTSADLLIQRHQDQKKRLALKSGKQEAPVLPFSTFGASKQ